MERQLAALAACLGVFVFASSAQGGTPNTTAAGAVSYEVGGGWITDGVDESSQNRWFVFSELAGRSYCVEATLAPATYFPLDPSLTLYTDSSGTVVYLSNTDGAGEPPQYKGARVCYQSALAVGTSTARLFNVNVPITAGSGDSGFARTRVIDTTLIFPMMCLSKTSTLYVANTTPVDINATLYVPGYGVKQTINNLKAPNQSTGKGKLLRLDLPGDLSWLGAVYLMNSGPPGALEAWVDTNDNCGSNTVRVYANPR